MSRSNFIDFTLSTIILYGIVLLIWTVIPRVNKTICKKDFITYWSIYSISCWVLAIIFLKISKNYIAEWFALSIIAYIASIIYFIGFRFWNDKKIIKESLSKNEKIGIFITSFIHFLISPIPSLAFFYIISRIVEFLIKLIGL